MDTRTQMSLQALKEKTDGHATEGRWSEAIDAVTESIRMCESNLGGSPGDLAAHAEALEIRADLLRQTGDNRRACEDYLAAIGKLEARDDCLIQLGRLHAGLGAAYVDLGEADMAASQWEHSIECFERNDPPSPLDVAAMANNFGFLKQNAGEFDAAETAFLKAMEILHSELGEGDEETATVASNLGALYQVAGHHEPACNMHAIALKARAALFGDNHPDTAQSNRDLGIALSMTGDRTAARRHLEKALHAYEMLGEESLADLEEVAFHYCDLLREDGEISMAEAVKNRVQDLVDLVDGKSAA